MNYVGWVCCSVLPLCRGIGVMEYLESLCSRLFEGGFVVLFGFGLVLTGSWLMIVELWSLPCTLFVLVFLVEAGVIGVFGIVVIVMMLAIVSEYFEILVVLMMPEIVHERR